MLDKKQPIVIALGYFDGVHKGHEKVIKSATDFAKSINAKTVVFTFSENIRSLINGEEQKYVYSPLERKEVLLSLGADEVCFSPYGKTFLKKGKKAFLNWLNDRYNIKAYVCGKDYRFGKFAKGDVSCLEEYSIKHNQQLLTVETYLFEGKKLSTSQIKNYLSNGEIEKVNQLLLRGFFLKGKVFSDRKVGRTLGFPTANLLYDNQKQSLKNGVYSCEVEVDGKRYLGISNFGSRPTFELDKTLVEVHIIDKEIKLYGKVITVYFKSFIRDVIRFDTANELKKQIQKDILRVKHAND